MSMVLDMQNYVIGTGYAENISTTLFTKHVITILSFSELTKHTSSKIDLWNVSENFDD
jgi:hypothetical protein